LADLAADQPKIDFILPATSMSLGKAIQSRLALEGLHSRLSG
jgi:hypothetical protein